MITVLYIQSYSNDCWGFNNLSINQSINQSINRLFSILSSTGTKKTQRFGNSHTEYIQQYK